MPKVTLNYAPHAAQKPFHLDRYKVKYRLLSGGTGSGKTKAGAAEAFGWAFECVGSVGAVFQPAYRKLKEVAVPAFEALLGEPLGNSPFIKKFNKTEMSLDIFNGSLIWLIGLDRPEAAEGMNLDWAWLDEARLVPKHKQARESIMRRLRGSGRSKPLDDKVPLNAVGFWETTTPDTPNSDLYNFYENPVTRDLESKVYRMTIDDNIQNLGASYVESVKRSHTGGLYDQFVLGLFAEIAGASFKYNVVIHTDGYNWIERNEVFAPSFEPRQIGYGVDFGWTAPSSVLAGWFDGDGRAYIFDEVYRTQMSQDELVKACLEMRGKWGEAPFFCDSSEPQTIEAMRLAGLDARPNISKRDDGIRELGGRFEVQGDGRPRIYVSPSCVNTIQEAQSYNADRKENDHAMDCCRYLIMGLREEMGGPQAWVGRRPR